MSDFLIDETYFTVTIGYSEIYKRNVYRITNKETGVVEYEHPMLGQVRAVLKVMNMNEEMEANGDSMIDPEEAFKNLGDVKIEQSH